jgi:hypothetical protein
MRRLLIFAALGPPIGALTGFWILLPAISLLAGDSEGVDVPQLLEAAPFLIPVAYMVGLLPALLVCVADEILARRGVRRRPLWCALFGFVAAFLPLATSFAMGFLHGPFVLAFGLIGAAPGAACSWIAGRWAGGGRRRSL